MVDIEYVDPLLDADNDTPLSATAVKALSFGLLAEAGKEGDSGDMPGSIRKWEWFSRLRPRWLLVITLTVATVVVLVLGTKSKPSNPKISKEIAASQLLTDAADQAARAVPPHGAIHATYELEVPTVQGGAANDEEVDVFRSVDSPLLSERLRTRNGELLASHSVDAYGKAHDTTAVHADDPRLQALTSASADDTWQHGLDIADFRRMAGGDSALRVRKLDGFYEVSFVHDDQQATAVVLEGHLRLADRSLRPVAETLVIRRKAERLTYQFRGVRYEVLRPDQIQPNDFQPVTYAPGRPHRTITAQTWIPMLYALWVLDEQPQSTQAAIDIVRGAAGETEVTGVLPTRQQAESLRRSFRSSLGGESLKINLHSADEQRSSAQRTSTAMPILSLQVEREDPPFAEILHDQQAGDLQLSESQDKERRRQIGRDLLFHSSRARRAAWTVRQIVAQDFRQAELSSMDKQDRNLWLTLLAHSVVACDRELRAIAALLSGETDLGLLPLPEGAPVNSISELALSSAVLQRGTERLDQQMTRDFAVSPNLSFQSGSPEELVNQLVEMQREERKLFVAVQNLQREGS